MEEVPPYTAESLGGDGPTLPEVRSAAGRPSGEPLRAPDPYASAHQETKDRLWWAGSTLYRRRWWIAAASLAAAVLAVVLTLQMPNQYRAETRVLLPSSGGGNLMASALAGIAPEAAALLGGGGGGFTRYLAILTSPSTLGQVVDRFDLVEVYDLGDEEHPRPQAIQELFARSAFEVSLDYDYLSVSVLDQSPERSAQISNYFVELLNRRNIELTSGSAGENRRFLEQRLGAANIALDSAQAEMQALQERTGVSEPTAQASALFSTLAEAEARVAEAEAQYQAISAQAGPENAAARSAAAALESARGQLARVRSGSQPGLPSIQAIPAVQRQYAGVLQDVILQTKIIETLQPLYEQAALEEQRDTDAVQVLDPATPPTRKAEPRRSLLVLATMFSVFLIAVALTLLLALVHRQGPAFLARLRAGA